MKVECVYDFRNIYVMYVYMYMLQQLRIKEIKNLKEKKGVVCIREGLE